METKMYHLPFSVFFCLLIPASLLAQDLSAIDSLKKLNREETDKKKIVSNLGHIAGKFSHNNPDSALFYIDSALNLSQEIDYKKGQAQSCLMQSYYYDVLGNTEQSISSLEQAKRVLIEIGDSVHLSGCYNNLGVYYSYGDNQKKSLEYFIKAIEVGEAVRDSFTLGEAYSNVAGFYADLKEYSSALKYYKKGFEIDLYYKDNNKIAVSHTDIGYINVKLRRFDDALEHLLKARELMPEIEDPYYKTMVYLRLAIYYNEAGDLSKAFENIQKAKDICAKYDYLILKADILSVEAEVLLKEKKYKQSLSVIDSAIVQYSEMGSSFYLNELYKNKAKVLSGLGLHDKAYQFLLMADKQDELSNKDVLAQILGNFEKEQTLKEERERFKLEQNLRIQQDENTLMKIRSRLYFTIFLSCFLAVILIVALCFYFVKRKHNKLLKSNYDVINRQKELLEKGYADLEKSEARLTELNATKDKFFSIIGHDLKNPFNTMIGISELLIENPDIDTQDYEELMQGLLETAKSGHDLLVNLLEWSRSQIGTLKMNSKEFEIGEIIKSTVLFFSETLKAKDIKIYAPTENSYSVYADYNMVNFIIRNIVNNAIKFSHKGSQIEFSIIESENELKICIKDYGIGMSQDTLEKLFKIEHSVQRNGTNNEKGTGLGLILCKEFVEKNKGTISVESTVGEGSLFCFSLPVK
ncbi:tetratricopeptide repeat-containing sensor histidine kinase [Maribellus maritimus]|uniref:tetratricopeptide repeat-containing sensor histidine kinase n=1 Tax=Maribellus maritimus TaxID=2870838 RepID=UPI001EEC6C9A|nr:tetratricopeptide repeat-containing sensor histidine kinase [Maribellus maritimus]MCG6190628.1 tetratricopeptide repeat protein [Maribellus maritimus]